MWRPKIDEFLNGKHMIFILERVCYYMSAQWNQFDAFELITNFPTYIIYSKLKSFRAVQNQEDSHLMKSFCYLLVAQFLHLLLQEILQISVKSILNLFAIDQRLLNLILKLISSQFAIKLYQQIILQIKRKMSSIQQLYSLQNSISTGGIQGYWVQKKYFDASKNKQQRILSQSKDKIVSAKPVNVSKKTTFIDDVQKISSKLPGPSSYQPTIKDKSKSKASDIIKYADRKTYFDELTHYEKKRHVPGAGAYGKIQTQADKTKLRSNLSKAETPTYLQACMRNSLQSPGVGNYNSYKPTLDHRGTKWVADPEKDKKKSVQKLPSVGTYNPKPSQYRLFSSITQNSKKKMSSQMGGKTQRFKDNSKQKKLPFYNILSEWGMKNKLQKKDILSNISSHPATSRSVYY